MLVYKIGFFIKVGIIFSDSKIIYNYSLMLKMGP